MKQVVITAVTAMLMLVACEKDNATIEKRDDGSPQRIEVRIDNDSRVLLNAENKSVWSAGDMVSVFYKTQGHECYRYSVATGSISGTLIWHQGAKNDEPVDGVVGVYPYSETTAIRRDGTINYVILPGQSYAKDRFGEGSSLMIGRSENSPQLYFKNMMGWVKITLTGTATISEITFKGNNNEQLTGLAQIKSDAVVLTGNDAGDSITLDCDAGVKLSSAPTTFFIALVPQTFAKGYTVTVVDNTGKCMTLKTDKTISISRNTVMPMSVEEYKPDSGGYTLSRTIPAIVPFNGGRYSVAFDATSATQCWQYRVTVGDKVITPATQIAGQSAKLDIAIDANYSTDRRNVVVEIAEAGSAVWRSGLESKQESALTMVGNYFWAKGNVTLRNGKFSIADTMLEKGLLFRDGSKYGVPSDVRSYAGTAYTPAPVQIKIADISRNEGYDVCSAISPELRLPTWAELDNLRGSEKSRITKEETLCMSYINSTFLMPIIGRMNVRDGSLYSDFAVYYGNGHDNEDTAVVYGLDMGENGYSVADFDYSLSDDYLGFVRCVRNIALPSYISHTPAAVEDNRGFELVVNTSRGSITSLYYIEVSDVMGANARTMRKQADAQGTARFSIPENDTNEPREWAIFVNGQDTGKRVKQYGR